MCLGPGALQIFPALQVFLVVGEVGMALFDGAVVQACVLARAGRIVHAYRPCQRRWCEFLELLAVCPGRMGERALRSPGISRPGGGRRCAGCILRVGSRSRGRSWSGRLVGQPAVGYAK